MPDAVPTNSLPEGAPQVQPGSGFTPNVSPAAFGAGIGQAVEGVASEARHMAWMDKRYMDQEAVADARTQVGLKRLQILKDPQTGLLDQNITDPDKLHSAADKAISDFDVHVSEAASGLTNDRQRAQFEKGMREERYAMTGAVRGWEMQQGNRIATSKMTAGVKLEQQSAAALYDTPAISVQGDEGTDWHVAPFNRVDPVAQSIDRQKTLIQATGEHLHWTPEQIQEAKAKAVNDTHVGVMRSMLVPGKDATQAADYFKAHQGEMFDDATKDTLGKAVAAASLQQQSGAIVHDLMYDDHGQQRPEADILDSMADDKRLTGDEKLSAAVEAQVSRKLRLHKEATNEAQTNTYNALWNMMPQAGFDMSRLPAEAVQSIKPEQQKQLQEYANNPRLAPDGSDAYYRLLPQLVKAKNNATDADPDGLRSAIQAARGSLSNNDYRKLMDGWSEVAGGGTPAGKKGLEIASTKEEILKDAVKGRSTDDANDLRRMADKMVEAQGGWEKVGTAGYQKIMDGLVINQAQERPATFWERPIGSWFGATEKPDQPAFKTIPEGHAFAPAQIPPVQRVQITSLLRARGIAQPTDEQILTTYNAGLTNAGP